MKLTKAERNLLQTFATLSRKILDSTAKSRKQRNGIRGRKRRSAADIALMKKQIRAARRQNVPVKQIADDLGVTTAYIYQLTR